MSVQPAVDRAATPIHIADRARRSPLRLPATLLLAGQLLYIAVTLFHAGGDANDHHVVFTGYAHSETWTVVHLGQFAGMALLLAGLLGTFSALDRRAGTTGWLTRSGVASATATLALYGALQAVDGVALKHAVDGWAHATEAEQAACMASAEAIRWLEWGVRSYQNVALGLALLLLAAAVRRVARLPRSMSALMALAGCAHLVQGWVVSVEGFSPMQSIAIVVALVLDVAWMTWFVVVAWRMPGAGVGS